MPRPKQPFWDQVLQGEGCWEWQGRLDVGGYGMFCYEQHDRRAHRLMWMFMRGPIPKGMFVCHHCDNRRCVKPDHLFLGTQQMNMDDMERKGRARKVRGSAQPSAKVTEADVPVIRARKAAGETNGSIARDYGVSDMTISCIVRKVWWAHVA